MNNVIQIAGFVNILCADGGIFELLGPVAIFGIYIAASIIKALAKKGNGKSNPEAESELKKAIERRRSEILQRQTGQPQGQTLKPPARPRIQPPQPVEKPAPIRQDQVTQWDLKQRAAQQRTARMENQEYQQARHREPLTVLKQRRDYHKYSPPQRSVPRRVSRKDVQSDVIHSVVSHKQTPKKHKEPAPVKKVVSQNKFLSLIKDRNQLRSAIILKEILDKPLALRE